MARHSFHGSFILRFSFLSCFFFFFCSRLISLHTFTQHLSHNRIETDLHGISSCLSASRFSPIHIYRLYVEKKKTFLSYGCDDIRNEGPRTKVMVDDLKEKRNGIRCKHFTDKCAATNIHMIIRILDAECRILFTVWKLAMDMDMDLIIIQQWIYTWVTKKNKHTIYVANRRNGMKRKGASEKKMAHKPLSPHSHAV